METEKISAAIFDMDGTLYQFPESKKFAQTKFGKMVKARTIAFIGSSFDLDDTGARNMYQDFSERWNGEISLGLETEHAIPREDFFAATWNLDPQRFIVPERNLVESLGRISVPVALLTAAPRVWAERALRHMAVREFFGDMVFTGDPDIRKPDIRAFQHVIDVMGHEPAGVVSIGDQEITDIVPAKLLGMKAIRIGGSEPSTADFVVSTISDAIHIVNERSRHGAEEKNNH